jgi:hypothetical protein
MDPELIERVNSFLNGIIFLGHGTAGLFFLRFWRKTHDRLFLMFAIAFWLLGVVRLAMMVLAQEGEDHYLYWFRLAAYLLILFAIVDKNLAWRKK